jgi:hypothetical protein
MGETGAMTSQELRDGLRVTVNWPHDDPEPALVVRDGRKFDLHFIAKNGEILSIMPDLKTNDRLLAILSCTDPECPSCEPPIKPDYTVRNRARYARV